MPENWIIYAIVGVLVCLLLWRVATQWKVKRYPLAATVNAKPGTIQYLAFLRSAAAKSIFEGYGFSVLAKPTS